MYQALQSSTLGKGLQISISEESELSELLRHIRRSILPG